MVARTHEAICVVCFCIALLMFMVTLELLAHKPKLLRNQKHFWVISGKAIYQQYI